MATATGTGTELLDCYANVDDEELSLLLDQGTMFSERSHRPFAGPQRGSARL